jgi:hypothetical protein
VAKRGSSRTGGLEGAAVNVGTALGKVAAKVDALKKERTLIAAEIRGVIRSAERMLADLGDDAAIARHRARKAVRRIGAKRNVSPEGRARILAALKRRWAKYHAEQKAAGRK